MTTSDSSLTPELLASHGSFVPRLAAALLADPHAADDLAQETLARALERPPRHVGRLRGWLAAVARSLRHERARRAQRAHAREQAVAQPEALPSALEHVVRMEQAQRMATAVQALAQLSRGHLGTACM